MATVLDLDIGAGGTFTEIITWYDTSNARVSLTGYGAALKIKDSEGNQLLSITNSGSGTTSRIKLEVDSTMNEEDPYAEVSPSSVGVITIFINATDTASLSGQTSNNYDLILFPNGTSDAENKKLVKGTAVVDQLVTS